MAPRRAQSRRAQVPPRRTICFVDLEHLSIRSLWCSTASGLKCFKVLEHALVAEATHLRALLDKTLNTLRDEELQALADAVLGLPDMPDAPSAAEEVAEALSIDRRGFSFDWGAMPGPEEAIALLRNRRSHQLRFDEAYSEVVAPVAARDFHTNRQYRVAFELVRALSESVGMLEEATGSPRAEIEKQLSRRLQ
jgi:hypothetical protein